MESVLTRQDGQGTEGDPRAPPKVIGVFPQGGAAEASYEHVVVRVMLCVPDGHINEETIIYP